MSGRVVTGEFDWSRYDNCMRISVVGESNYQPALVRVSKCPPTGDHRYECSAELVLEPTNPYDENAVMVKIDRERVGYLPRAIAKEFGGRLRSLAKQGKPAICMAFVGRSVDAGHDNLGVSLHLPYDGEILQAEG